MTKKQPGAKLPEDSHLIIDAISKIVADFCRDHLDEEYAVLCRKLTEKLARKRPSPLLNGNPNAWACGIIRTIGRVNFLDDRSQSPHRKLTAIDNAFEVAEITGQDKSKLIRTTLKIPQFDHHWTLPSRMDDPRQCSIGGPGSVSGSAFSTGCSPCCE